MNNKSKKKKRLNAKQFHEKVTKARKKLGKEFGFLTWNGTKEQGGKILALLIDSGLITHDNGTDSYDFGLTLACIINVKRANGKKENLKHTSIHEAIKIAKADLNYEKKRKRK
jgi:hypothetical protein